MVGYGAKTEKNEVLPGFCVQMAYDYEYLFVQDSATDITRSVSAYRHMSPCSVLSHPLTQFSKQRPQQLSRKTPRPLTDLKTAALLWQFRNTVFMRVYYVKGYMCWLSVSVSKPCLVLSCLLLIVAVENHFVIGSVSA